MKKLISIILTACICLSLLGGISFAGAEDTATVEVFSGSYTYNFLSGQGDNRITSGTDLYTVKDYTNSSFFFFGADEMLTELIGEVEKSEGAVETLYFYDNNEVQYPINVNGAKTRITKVRNDYFRFLTSNETYFGTFPDGRWIALKLDASKIPEGTYDVTLNLDRADYGHEIYFAPYDSEQEEAKEYLNSSNKIADVSNRNVKTITATDIKLNSVATEYVLIIKQKKSQETKLVSITFDRQMDYEVTHAKEQEITYNLNGDSFKAEAFNSLKASASDAYINFHEGKSKYLNWNTIYGRESFMDFEKTAPWCFDYENGTKSDRIMTGEDSHLRVDLNENKCFVIRVYVPNSGTFNVAAETYKRNKDDAGSVDVYLTESKGNAYNSSDVAEYMATAAEKEKLGSVDTKAGTSFPEKKVVLEAGEYAFIFVPTASRAGRTHIASITLTPVDDAGYTEAFKESDSEAATYAPSVVAYAYAKDNTDIGVTASAKDDDADGVWSLEAPEYAGDNNEYKFLYWVKGLTTSNNRLVVSTSAIYNEYVPQNNANYVIAVYDKGGEDSKAEFYNANGQLIETREKDDNAPTLPYMAGYGQASNWALHGTSTKISGGDPVTLSGNMIFFAQYDTTTPDTFEITVNGKSKTYNYGQLVECKADATDTDGNIFYGWTKTVNGGDAQLVSVDQTYTFRAWENCTVTPVYKKTTGIIFDGAKRKILLGTFDLGGEQAVMAEYIGFDAASEKGIILGAQEIAMTSDNNQFTVINSENATNISGYAILDNFKYIFKK